MAFPHVIVLVACYMEVTMNDFIVNFVEPDEPSL